MKFRYSRAAALSFAAVTALAGCSASEKTNPESSETVSVIRFATEGTYSPFSYHDESGELTGYDVEVAKAVAKELGAEAEFVETPWDGLISGLDAGKSDVAANQISITEERKEKYTFTDPYTYSYGVLIVPQDSEITAFEDLEGLNSAQTATSNWGKLAESFGASLVQTGGFSESIALVEQARADATINDNVTYLDYLSQKPDSATKIAAYTPDSVQTAFMLRKDDTALAAQIDEALETLRANGTLKEIAESFFQEDISSEKEQD
jgi:cystine transport system substrate-binding protein